MPPPSIPSTAVRSQCLITNSNSACQLNEPYYKSWPSLPFALLSTQTTIVLSPHTNECQWMSMNVSERQWMSGVPCKIQMEFAQKMWSR